MSTLESAISSVYDPGVEMILSSHRSQDGQLDGSFLGADGRVFNFSIANDEIEFQESHQDSEYINEYFSGILFGEGVEYHGDSAYEYWKGFNEIETRTDAKAMKCTKGGVPCGGRCLPAGQKCRSKLGTAAKLAVGAAAAGAAAYGAHKLNQSINNPTLAKVHNRYREKVINEGLGKGGVVKRAKSYLAEAGKDMEASVRSGESGLGAKRSLRVAENRMKETRISDLEKSKNPFDRKAAQIYRKKWENVRKGK